MEETDGKADNYEVMQTEGPQGEGLGVLCGRQIWKLTCTCWAERVMKAEALTQESGVFWCVQCTGGEDRPTAALMATRGQGSRRSGFPQLFCPNPDDTGSPGVSFWVRSPVCSGICLPATEEMVGVH